MIKTEWKLEIYQQKVEKRIEWQRRRILFQTAGYVRTTVKNSIKTPRATKKKKKKKKTSTSGKPPKSRSGRLKSGVNFAVDLKEGSFVVGVTPNKTQTTKPHGGLTVPQLIDEGGRATFEDFRGKQHDGVFEPHPYMTYQPTLNVAERKFAEKIETIGLT